MPAGTEAIDSSGDVLDELAEARLVVGSDQRPIGLTLAGGPAVNAPVRGRRPAKPIRAMNAM
jgi:hypothetical protein